MKMTPLLAVINTLLSILLGAYALFGIGALNSRSLEVFLLLPLLLIFITNTISGWMVLSKNPGHIIISVWRVTETISVIIFLLIAGGALIRNL
jgi:hypothetical protein